MILCVNPNAAIDKTVVVEHFTLDKIHRPIQVTAFPGGKGCNVARALHTMGDHPVVTGWVGGSAGQFIEKGLHAEGIETAFVYTDFESRTCLSILDPINQTMTEVYEKGETVPEDKVAEIITLFRDIVGRYQAVTLSGSLPKGVPLDFYAQVIRIGHQAGVPIILDSSGDALRLGLEAKPRLVKPNKDEFSALVGQALDSLADFVAAAHEVARQYETTVVLSLGPDGAVAANGQEAVHVIPPPVDAVSAVGSGDSMLAGLTYGLTHAFSFEDALRYGVAGGTANTLRLGAGNFTREDFEQVLAGVTMRAC